jgi:membrane protease YdiL (CAAX protease family)
MSAPTRLPAFLTFPLTRIVIGLALCLGIGVAAMLGMQQLLNHSSLSQEDKDPISGTLFAFLVCATYIFLYQRLEKRKITELSTPRLPQRLAAGILLGATLAAAIVLIQYLAHSLTVTATRSLLPLLPNLWNTFVNSTIAEVLIIGIFFRIIEEWLGTYIALTILIVTFFVLHITAPGATVISAACVAMHAALLNAASYIYTRSLWVPISIHFAWDFSFAAIAGASVNGNTFDNSLLATTANGPDLFTGGYFGPQGSIQAGLLCLLTGAMLLRLSQKNNHIIRRRTL